MASGKDLTRLATLAGMAYIANKMGDKDKGDSGSTRAARPESVETRAAPEAPTADESTKSDVLKAITAKREAPNDEAPSEGVIADTPAPVKSKRAATSTTASKYPSGVMAGARPAPSTTSSSEEGMKNYKPRRSVPPTPPTVSKTTPPAATPSAAKPSTEKSSNRVPTPEEAAANRQAAYNKVKGIGSSMADYVKNFETPAERAARERKESSGMKRGGAVKKMASGGMTASRRADGIATRGKTKCKMY